MTAAQLVAVFNWLLNVQAQAAKATPTAYGCNVTCPSIDDDAGIVQATITITATQSAAFAAADIQAIQNWISSNITGSGVSPSGVAIKKSYSWMPT
jgi:hypothetical protein